MKNNILDSYDKASKEFGYNSNSLHKLGFDARNIEKAASNQILKVLELNNYDVIYTSGNLESFTTILKNIKKDISTNSKEFEKLAKDNNVNINKESKIKHLDLDLNTLYKDLNNYDYITIEDDIPFFGVLLKKKNINIENLIHGGKSTTNFRSGTSVTPLIVTMSKLIKLKYKK